MSRLTRDGTAEPASRDQFLKREREQGDGYFPCSADHEQDWQPYPVDPYFNYMCDHTYIYIYRNLRFIDDTKVFEPRELASHLFENATGHAAVVFKEKLWVVGGTGELYQTYNFRYHKRRGDVWSSEDGFTWIQNNNLTGDFHLQNYDAADPGSLAPWYARFGHTLDVLAVPDSNGTATELMILAGGYTPNADNDVWVTEDGSESFARAPLCRIYSE